MKQYSRRRVAATHVDPMFLDSEKTIGKACSLIEGGANNSASLVAFSDAYRPSFPLWDRLRAPTFNHEYRPYKDLEQSLREALRQQEILYQELAHRVKNHLQIMSALIRSEARNPALSAAALAERMGAHLHTLAAVYDGMVQAGAAGAIEARAFAEAICQPYRSDSVTVTVSVCPADVTLTSEQAGALGMLVNEAVCNSRKHAFPGRRGQIWVSFHRIGPGGLRVEISDDGVGWKPDGAERSSHGLALMRRFAKQPHGVFALFDRPGGGAGVRVDLPQSAQTSRQAHAASASPARPGRPSR